MTCASPVWSGFATGWLGLGHAFVGFFAAFVLGALVGIGAMVVSGAGRKTRIPFGPFLAAGAVVAVRVGQSGRPRAVPSQRVSRAARAPK